MAFSASHRRPPRHPSSPSSPSSLDGLSHDSGATSNTKSSNSTGSNSSSASRSTVSGVYFRAPDRIEQLWNHYRRLRAHLIQKEMDEEVVASFLELLESFNVLELVASIAATPPSKKKKSEVGAFAGPRLPLKRPFLLEEDPPDLLSEDHPPDQILWPVFLKLQAQVRHKRVDSELLSHFVNLLKELQVEVAFSLLSAVNKCRPAAPTEEPSVSESPLLLLDTNSRSNNVWGRDDLDHDTAFSTWLTASTGTNNQHQAGGGSNIDSIFASSATTPATLIWGHPQPAAGLAGRNVEPQLAAVRGSARRLLQSPSSDDREAIAELQAQTEKDRVQLYELERKITQLETQHKYDTSQLHALVTQLKDQMADRQIRLDGLLLCRSLSLSEDES